VRQLENTIERSVALESGDELNADVPLERAKNHANGSGNGNGQVAVPAEGIDMESYVADIEKNMLLEALRKSGGVQTRAAEMLKLSYRSFRHLMKKYEL
jgi:two-component system, NtrC family, response regulator PilR